MCSVVYKVSNIHRETLVKFSSDFHSHCVNCLTSSSSKSSCGSPLVSTSVALTEELGYSSPALSHVLQCTLHLPASTLTLPFIKQIPYLLCTTTDANKGSTT